MFREAAGRNFDRLNRAFADGDETQQALDDLHVGYETAQSERKWSQGGVREGGERKAHFTQIPMQVAVDEFGRGGSFPGTRLMAPMFAWSELRVGQRIEFGRDAGHWSGRDLVAELLQSLGGNP